MTAIVEIITKDYAIIGSDSLATYPKEVKDTELQPRSYTSKTFLLLQFKSAFAVSGTLQVGLCFFNLINESAYGIDIDSLINIELKFFKEKLKTDYEIYPTGNIYLTGYSNNSKKFKGFKLFVDKDSELVWQELPSDSIIFKPIIEDWENKISIDNKDSCELITKLMRIQKKEDEQKELIEQVGIGGQILCTQLTIDSNTKNIIIVSKIVYEFEDYISLGNKMIKK